MKCLVEVEIKLVSRRADEIEIKMKHHHLPSLFLCFTFHLLFLLLKSRKAISFLYTLILVPHKLLQYYKMKPIKCKWLADILFIYF